MKKSKRRIRRYPIKRRPSTHPTPSTASPRTSTLCWRRLHARRTRNTLTHCAHSLSAQTHRCGPSTRRPFMTSARSTIRRLFVCGGRPGRMGKRISCRARSSCTGCRALPVLLPHYRPKNGLARCCASCALLESTLGAPTAGGCGRSPGKGCLR